MTKVFINGIEIENLYITSTVPVPPIPPKCPPGQHLDPITQVCVPDVIVIPPPVGTYGERVAKAIKLVIPFDNGWGFSRWNPFTGLTPGTIREFLADPLLVTTKDVHMVNIMVADFNQEQIHGYKFEVTKLSDKNELYYSEVVSQDGNQGTYYDGFYRKGNKYLVTLTKDPDTVASKLEINLNVQ